MRHARRTSSSFSSTAWATNCSTSSSAPAWRFCSPSSQWVGTHARRQNGRGYAVALVDVVGKCAAGHIEAIGRMRRHQENLYRSACHGGLPCLEWALLGLAAQSSGGKNVSSAPKLDMAATESPRSCTPISRVRCFNTILDSARLNSIATHRFSCGRLKTR